MTSVADIHAALVARLATVAGLSGCLGYFPTSISPPMIFIPAPRAEYIVQGGQLYINALHFDATLCLHWQQNQKAEQEVLSWYGLVPAALLAQPGLGLGAMAQLENDVRPGFISISQATYRTIVYPIRVKYSGVIS